MGNPYHYFRLIHGNIASLEFRYQKYVIKTSRSGRIWIVMAVFLLAPAIITSLALWFIGLTGRSPTAILNERHLLLTGHTTLTEQGLRLGMVTFVTMNIALYLVVTLVALALSANSVTREKLNKTWDLLILTNVDAQEMVWGKWWASLKALAGDYGMVGLLRFGVAGGIVAANTPHLSPLPLGAPVEVGHLLLMTLSLGLFTAIDAALTAALGIAGALAEAPGSVTNTLVVSARVFGIGVELKYGWFLLNRIRDGEPYLGATLIGLSLLVGMTWFVLWASQQIATRGQVSPPPA